MKALVTGAGKRLGRGIALYLADCGYDVAVHYASSGVDAEQTVAEIVQKGHKACALQADLLLEGDMQTLIARAAEGLGGPLTLLVNNASIFEYDNIETATQTSWDRHMQSNLRAPFVLLQNFAAQAPTSIRDENGEPIAQALCVNMIDQRVRKLTPEFMTYTLAKSALWTLTQTAAQALAPNVRVNGIGPGPTMQGVRQSDTHFNNQRKATILERGAGLNDVTKSLRFFMDSPSVTGQLLCVDGGQHLGWQTPDIQGITP